MPPNRDTPCSAASEGQLLAVAASSAMLSSTPAGGGSGSSAGTSANTKAPSGATASETWLQVSFVLAQALPAIPTVKAGSSPPTPVPASMATKVLPWMSVPGQVHWRPSSLGRQSRVGPAASKSGSDSAPTSAWWMCQRRSVLDQRPV